MQPTSPAYTDFPFGSVVPTEFLLFSGPIFGLIVSLAILDIALKGWALWRAARMGKQIWFVALLVVNSAGILPGIFLFITRDEYASVLAQVKATKSPAPPAPAKRPAPRKKTPAAPEQREPEAGA